MGWDRLRRECDGVGNPARSPSSVLRAFAFQLPGEQKESEFLNQYKKRGYVYRRKKTNYVKSGLFDEWKLESGSVPFCIVFVGYKKDLLFEQRTEPESRHWSSLQTFKTPITRKTQNYSFFFTLFVLFFIRSIWDPTHDIMHMVLEIYGTEWTNRNGLHVTRSRVPPSANGFSFLKEFWVCGEL